MIDNPSPPLFSARTRQELAERSCLPHSRVLMHRGSAGIGGIAVDVELLLPPRRPSAGFASRIGGSTR